MIDTIKAELEAINMDINQHSCNIKETQSSIYDLKIKVEHIESSIVDLKENIDELSKAFNDFTSIIAAGMLR